MSETMQSTPMGAAGFLTVPMLADVETDGGAGAIVVSRHSDYRLPAGVEHIPTDSDEEIYDDTFEIPVYKQVKLRFGSPQKMEFVLIDD